MLAIFLSKWDEKDKLYDLHDSQGEKPEALNRQSFLISYNTHLSASGFHEGEHEDRHE